MINLKDNQKCICKKYKSFHGGCKNQYTFTDSGKSIELNPKDGDTTILIAVDGCLINSKTRKCDCLFIYKTKNNRNYTFLVELKGKNHIKDAFEQLCMTKINFEYQNILAQLNNPINKYIIVSDIPSNKIDIQKLEKAFQIRVGEIVHSTPQTPIPDLKKYI